MDKKWAKGFIMGLIAAIAGILIGLYFSSCQPSKDPLSNAEFSCECIYKGYEYEIHFQCQEEKPYKFKDEKYYKRCNEGDIINESLN